MFEVLTRLTLRNFQVHRELRWDLAPGVNTIVGPSDVGKSAIIRALRWLACNVPSGDMFRRWGSRVTQVDVEMADGTVVVRGRSKTGDNFYKLNGKRFVSFGSDPPDAVAAVLAITTDNFQQQHDSPFWLSETAGEIGRQLNRIVNLELIDIVLSKLAALARQATATVSALTEAVKERTADVAEVVFVEAVNEDLANVETSLTKWNCTADKRVALVDLIEKFERIEAYRGKAVDLVAVGQMVISAGEEEHKGIISRVELFATIDAVERYTADAAIVVPVLSDLEAACSAADAAHSKVVGLFATISVVLGCQIELETAAALAESAKVDFTNRMGDVCLLCGKPTSP